MGEVNNFVNVDRHAFLRINASMEYNINMIIII